MLEDLGNGFVAGEGFFDFLFSLLGRIPTPAEILAAAEASGTTAHVNMPPNTRLRLDLACSYACVPCTDGLTRGDCGGSQMATVAALAEHQHGTRHRRKVADALEGDEGDEGEE